MTGKGLERNQKRTNVKDEVKRMMGKTDEEMDEAHRHDKQGHKNGNVGDRYDER